MTDSSDIRADRYRYMQLIFGFQDSSAESTDTTRRMTYTKHYTFKALHVAQPDARA